MVIKYPVNENGYILSLISDKLMNRIMKKQGKIFRTHKNERKSEILVTNKLTS